jgi:hypothetical protein
MAFGIKGLMSVTPGSVYLAQFTESVMRGPGTFPAWQRELIAAISSSARQCVY